MPSETEISLILSQMDKTRHLMPQSSSSSSNPQQQGQQQQQHYPQQQHQMQFHHLPQMPSSSYDSSHHQHHQNNNHPGFPPMPQSDIPVASTSSGHPHSQLIQQQQGQGQQQNDPNNSNSATSPQHPPLPPLPPNVSPGRSRASRAAKSAAQIMAGLQQQRGREADNYISGLTGGANGSGEMGEDDDDDDGDDDVYEEDTAEAERDLAHDETMLAEEMLHMKNEGSQSGSQGNNNSTGSHQQQPQQLHQLPLHQDGGSLSYDPSHHHQYLQQGHYPPIPSSTLPGIINPPPMPEPEIQVGTPATPADGEDGSDGDDSQGGGKNRPRGRKPKNQFGAGLQKDSSEYQKLRKENHKNVEKKRRETINDGIKRLSLLVPGADKNKSKIIAQAAEYIAELKEAEHGYIEKWTLEKLMLEQNLRDLSAQNEDLGRRLADKERRVAQLESGMGMGGMNGNGGNNGGM